MTLFHKAGSPASQRVVTLLKQASANASETATLDQASDVMPSPREPFELNITEEPPTPDQLQTILEYVGTPGIPAIVRGAHSPNEALRKFRESKDNFQRPVVRD